MPKLIQSRYNQGLAAYRAGHGLGHLLEVGEEIERQHDSRAEAIGSPATTPDHDDREAVWRQREELHAGEFGRDAMPSLTAGFADGLIGDIRALAGAQRGQKA